MYNKLTVLARPRNIPLTPPEYEVDGENEVN